MPHSWRSLNTRTHWRTKVHAGFQDIDHTLKPLVFDLVYRISYVSSAYVLKSDMDRYIFAVSTIIGGENV